MPGVCLANGISGIWNMSLMLRFFRSVSTAIQNMAPSPPVPAHRPGMSLSPARLTTTAA